MTSEVAVPSPISRTTDFDLQSQVAGRWNNGSAVRSQLFNTLSVFLPAGEAFFVDTVRGFAQPASRPNRGELQRDVALFLKQESAHRRWHERYNAVVSSAYPTFLAPIRYMNGHWRLVGRITSRRARLAITVAIEHLTTVLSRRILSDASLLEGAEPEFSSLWRWHALEELEHKSVAYDLYVSTYGSARGLKYYMRIVVVLFVVQFAGILLRVLKQERLLLCPATWRELAAGLRSDAARVVR